MANRVLWWTIFTIERYCRQLMFNFLLNWIITRPTQGTDCKIDYWNSTYQKQNRLLVDFRGIQATNSVKLLCCTIILCVTILTPLDTSSQDFHLNTMVYQMIVYFGLDIYSTK